MLSSRKSSFRKSSFIPHNIREIYILSPEEFNNLLKDTSYQPRNILIIYDILKKEIEEIKKFLDKINNTTSDDDYMKLRMNIENNTLGNYSGKEQELINFLKNSGLFNFSIKQSYQSPAKTSSIKRLKSSRLKSFLSK